MNSIAMNILVHSFGDYMYTYLGAGLMGHRVDVHSVLIYVLQTFFSDVVFLVIYSHSLPSCLFSFQRTYFLHSKESLHNFIYIAHIYAIYMICVCLPLYLCLCLYLCLSTLYIIELNVLTTLVSQQSNIPCYAGVTNGMRSAGLHLFSSEIWVSQEFIHWCIAVAFCLNSGSCYNFFLVAVDKMEASLCKEGVLMEKKNIFPP